MRKMHSPLCTLRLPPSVFLAGRLCFSITASDPLLLPSPFAQQLDCTLQQSHLVALLAPENIPLIWPQTPLTPHCTAEVHHRLQTCRDGPCLCLKNPPNPGKMLHPISVCLCLSYGIDFFLSSPSLLTLNVSFFSHVLPPSILPSPSFFTLCVWICRAQHSSTRALQRKKREELGGRGPDAPWNCLLPIKTESLCYWRAS